MSTDRLSLLRRIGASLAFGFLLVFGFAILGQLAVDFIDGVLGIPMEFLLPLGLANALIDIKTLLDIVSGLAILSLFVAVVFFILMQRQSALRNQHYWRRDDGEG